MNVPEVLQLAAACGGSSYVAVLAANRTNIANIKKRLDEVIQELKDLRTDHHALDKRVVSLHQVNKEAIDQ